ncbi:hypothetical protein DES32_0198 [Methylovirgula ligni]|uniref:Uncharacterized protein n=1 Tax=Methylovirgula ligni TaxID=569860 RepID=A0A3D9Z1C3_9HYPH|nr:hypothetical protein DES32_0198 [Methylovirgula ligni]
MVFLTRAIINKIALASGLRCPDHAALNHAVLKLMMQELTKV